MKKFGGCSALEAGRRRGCHLIWNLRHRCKSSKCVVVPIAVRLCYIMLSTKCIKWNRKTNLWTLSSCIFLYCNLLYIGMSLDSEPFLESSLCVAEGRSPSHSLGRSKASYRKRRQNLRSQPRHLDLKKGLFPKFNERSTERERESALFWIHMAWYAVGLSLSAPV